MHHNTKNDNIKCMENCILIHGCPSNQAEQKLNERHWLSWIRRKLEEKGWKVEDPLMPTAWAPKYEEWKGVLDKLSPDKDTVIVTHSCGGPFAVHWLGDTRRRIKKLILVAPSKIPSEGSTQLAELYNFEIDSSIKDRVEDIVIFTSNDEERHRQSAKIYADALNGKIYDLENRGHYTYKDMQTEAFPELLEEILK